MGHKKRREPPSAEELLRANRWVVLPRKLTKTPKKDRDSLERKRTLLRTLVCASCGSRYNPAWERTCDYSPARCAACGTCVCDGEC